MNDMRKVADAIPNVPDRMLLELGNSVTVTTDLARRRPTVIGRLLDTVTGRGARTDAIVKDALASGQEGLTAWVTEVCARGEVTALNLARVTRHVHAARTQLNRVESAGRRTADELHALTALLGEAHRAIHDRLDGFAEDMVDVRNRLDVVELKQEAAEAFDHSTGAWANGQTYSGLPWLFQVSLLVQHVAAGPAGAVEHLTGDSGFRERLVHRILGDASTRAALGGSFTLPVLLTGSLEALPSDGHRLLTAELHGAGLSQELAPPVRPLTTTVRTALELAALPQGTPADPGRTALELTRMRHGWVDASADPLGFVRLLVDEHADSALDLRRSQEVDNAG
ncbi:hypothetical protein OHR68_33910 [Spirillospora sp. NBC_00431]